MLTLFRVFEDRLEKYLETDIYGKVISKSVKAASSRKAKRARPDETFAIWDKNDFPLSHAALYMLSTLLQKTMLCDFPHLFPLEIKHKKQTPFSFFEASLTLKLHGSSYTSVDLYIIGTH